MSSNAEGGQRSRPTSAGSTRVACQRRAIASIALIAVRSSRRKSHYRAARQCPPSQRPAPHKIGDRSPRRCRSCCEHRKQGSRLRSAVAGSLPGRAIISARAMRRRYLIECCVLTSSSACPRRIARRPLRGKRA